jgi:hypothetical protein
MRKKAATPKSKATTSVKVKDLSPKKTPKGGVTRKGIIQGK